MFIYQPRRVTRWCSRQFDQIRKVAVLRQTSKPSFGARHTRIYFSLKGTSKIMQPTSSAINWGTSVSGHLWWSEFKFCLLLSFHYAKSSCHPKFYSGDCIQAIFAMGIAKNLHRRRPSHSPSIHCQWFLFANVTTLVLVFASGMYCTISTGCSRHTSQPKKTILFYSP